MSQNWNSESESWDNDNYLTYTPKINEINDIKTAHSVINKSKSVKRAFSLPKRRRTNDLDRTEVKK